MSYYNEARKAERKLRGLVKDHRARLDKRKAFINSLVGIPCGLDHLILSSYALTGNVWFDSGSEY
jgi:hypothetical protein